MEYAIGFALGILVTVLAGILALYLLLRDKTAGEVPTPPPPATEAVALTALITEPFLNDQLRQILNPDTGNAAGRQAVVPQSVGPVKIKVNNAALKLLPDRRARLTIQLTLTAMGLSLNLRPVTEFAFSLQPGRVRILITRILLEGITIPRQWVDSFISSYVAGAEEQLNHYLRLMQNETGVNLTELETSGELLILKFG